MVGSGQYWKKKSFFRMMVHDAVTAEHTL